MGSLVAQSAGLRLTLHDREPADDDRLRGAIESVDGRKPRSVRVGLALIAHHDPERYASSAITGELALRASSTVEVPGSFTLRLPPEAASYTGAHFRIEVGVRATADDGRELRALLDPQPRPDPDTRLRVRQLPARIPLARPAAFVGGLVATLVGASLVGAAVWTDSLAAFVVGIVLAVAGGLVARASAPGLGGWLRVGPASAHLATGPDGTLRVSVRTDAKVIGGQVRVRALEFAGGKGPDMDLREVTWRGGALARSSDGAWTTTIALPDASEAPPSLRLLRVRGRLGIRWELEIGLQCSSGAAASFSVPLAVGVDRT